MSTESSTIRTLTGLTPFWADPPGPACAPISRPAGGAATALGTPGVRAPGVAVRPGREIPPGVAPGLTGGPGRAGSPDTGVAAESAGDADDRKGGRAGGGPASCSRGGGRSLMAHNSTSDPRTVRTRTRPEGG